MTALTIVSTRRLHLSIHLFIRGQSGILCVLTVSCDQALSLIAIWLTSICEVGFRSRVAVGTKRARPVVGVYSGKDQMYVPLYQAFI